MTKKFFIALSISALAICGCSEKNMDRQDPEDAKKYFVDAAQNTIKELDASNFTQAFEFIDSSIVAITKSDAPDSLKKVMKRAVKALGTTKKDTTFRDYKGVSYSKYMDVRVYEDVLFDLSAFNNLYTVDAKNKCTVANSNSLSLVLNNSKLGKIDFTVTKSSKETYVKIFKSENDTTRYGSTYLDKYGYVYQYVIKDGLIAVKVPENIKLTASLNGKEIGSIQINANLDVNDALFYNETPDLDVIAAAKGNISINVKLSGYSVAIDRIGADTQKAYFTTSIKKGRKTLLAVDGVVEGYKVTERTLPVKSIARKVAKFDFDADNVSINVNIHDDVQAEAKCKWAILDTLMAYSPSGATEAKVKSFVNLVNTGVESGIYFGDNTKQAEFILQYKMEGKDIKLIPCIQFTKDESIYTMEEYFTSTEFMHVAVDAMKLAQDFMAVLPISLPSNKN